MQDTRPSGASDDMLIEMAKKIYHDETNTHFFYEHWWKEVRIHPKWERSTTQNKRTKLDGSGSYTSSQSRGSEHQESNEHKSSPQVRPQGIKAAKMARKKGKGKAQLSVDSEETTKFYSFEEKKQASINAMMEIEKGKQATQLQIAKEKTSATRDKANAITTHATLELERSKIELEKSKFKSMQTKFKMFKMYCDFSKVDESTLTPMELEKHRMQLSFLETSLAEFQS
jgi:hypothetical protein